MGALLTTARPLDIDVTVDERVRAATLACVARFGLTKTTLDDIARESGVSRATIYRTFPGGRDVLFQSVLSQEVDRFFEELGHTLDEHDDLEGQLVAGLVASMRFLREHDALRAVVHFEPGLLLPQFAFHRLGAVLSRAAAFASPYLEPHVGRTRARQAAEHLVRIVLSYTLTPDPSVDPTDLDSIRSLVRQFVLPGLVADDLLDLRTPDSSPSDYRQPSDHRQRDQK